MGWVEMYLAGMGSSVGTTTIAWPKIYCWVMYAVSFGWCGFVCQDNKICIWFVMICDDLYRICDDLWGFVEGLSGFVEICRGFVRICKNLYMICEDLWRFVKNGLGWDGLSWDGLFRRDDNSCPDLRYVVESCMQAAPPGPPDDYKNS